MLPIDSIRNDATVNNMATIAAGIRAVGLLGMGGIELLVFCSAVR